MPISSPPWGPSSKPTGATPACVLAGCWLALTIGFVEPLQAALPNWDGLSVDFTTMLLGLGRVALLLLAAFVPLAVLSARLVPVHASALWTSICLAAWLQGDLFVWDYGTFDGSPLDWTVHSGKGWLELVAWVGLPSLSLLNAAWVSKNARKILGGVLALQIAGLLGILQHNAPYIERDPPRVVTPKSAFATMSSDLNAIVVVLDALQSDVFAAAMQSPELNAKLPGGFVFYPDAISMYRSTKFSLPSILTSRAIPEGVDAMNWRARAMRTSLPVVLAKHGFDTRLASFVPGELACGHRSSGLRCTPLAALGLLTPSQVFEIEWRADLSLLVRLAIFRLSPHILKPRVYDVGEWGVPDVFPRAVFEGVDAGLPPATRTDLEALAQLASRVTTDDGPPRFRFLHLNAVHFPGRASADCVSVEQPNLRRRQIETAQCVLGKLFEFFQALDAVGAYDPSAIVVIADHGSHQLGGLDTSLLAPAPKFAAFQKGEAFLPLKWWRGVPMFAVKQIGARGPLRTSDRAVSLCDVPATIFDAVGIEMTQPFGCESVRGTQRKLPRMHYDYFESPRQKHFSRAKRFRFKFSPVLVDGHSWDRNSWVRCRPGCEEKARGTKMTKPGD